MLVGRQAELERISRLLADAARGRSGALVLHGEAGVGKTALLETALARADGFTVLHVVAVETEADLAFGGLHSLLRPLLDRVDEIPRAQASALRAALALEDEPPERLRAFAGTLSLLAAAAERGPLLVAVDDAQWLDKPSAAALGFAARRIAREGIAMLAAAREVDGPLGAGIESLRVAPLDDGASLRLLQERWHGGIAPGVARRIAAAAGGIPLGLLEVSELLSDRERAGLDPVAEPLPVTDAVGVDVRKRLRGLSEAARRALLLAAAADSPPELPLEALDEAEAAGLVRLDGGRVRFRHPLVRSAVYLAASPEQRRSAHLDLAASYERGGEVDLSAWHVAAATDGPDEEVASLLEAAARRAAERGGSASEARALTRAAELSPEDDARARRLNAAAAAAYLAGEPEQAMRLAEQALLHARERLLRADVLHRRAVIADWYGTWHDRAVPDDELEREAEALEPLDPLRSVALLGVLLQRRFQALDVASALALAERRVALAEPLGGERHLRTLQDLARAAGLAGDARRCAELCELVLQRCPRDDAPAFATNIAEPLLWLERHELCRSLLAASVQSARAEGNVVRLTFELTNAALLEHRSGRFRAALAAASEALDLARETGNDYLLACNLALAARVEAVRGDRGCRGHAEQALALAERLADRLIAAEATMALAEAALVGRRPEEAVRLLEPLRELAVRRGVGEPAVLPFAPDLVEAYRRSGRRRDAALELERLAGQAGHVGRRWALAAVERLRGLAAAPGDVEERFRAALALHEAGAGSAFDRARTQLLFGERLRRGRRRVAAREQLRAALRAFEEVGAGAWAERARAELAATGETISRRDDTVPERLTPQELQIALQVAEGKTNREVAAALFLSPKTVEFHLTGVYRKLGLGSRGELIRLLARDGALTPALAGGLA